MQPQEDVPPILYLIFGPCIAIVAGLLSFAFYKMETQEETDQMIEEYGWSPIDFYFKVFFLVAGCGWLMAVHGFMGYFFPIAK